MNLQCEVCGGDPNACDSASGSGRAAGMGRADAAALGHDATRDTAGEARRDL